MTEGAWGLLSQMDTPVAKKKRTRDDLRKLCESFVELLMQFFSQNDSFLAILRHEARRGGAMQIVTETVTPVFDAVVGRLEEMRARGEIRKDFETRHFVLSCVAMIAFPFQEEPFVRAIWPVEWTPKHLADRKNHVVDMILARVAL